MGFPSVGGLSPLFVEEVEAVRDCVLGAGTGIFEGLEKVSAVKGCSKIFFNEAPFPPLTLLEPSALAFMLVIGSSADFGARTGDVSPFDLLFSFSFAARSDALFCCATPVPIVRLVRLGTVLEDEGRDFASELAVGAKSVEEERFTPVLPVVRLVPTLPLLLPVLLVRLLAVPLVAPRSSDSRFLWPKELLPEAVVTEEAVVEVVAVALEPEPNPKRLVVGLKELFEPFEEVLSLGTVVGFVVEAAGLTAVFEEATGILVGFGGSAVPVPFQTFFTRFLAEDRNPNLEVVPLFFFALARDGRPALLRGPAPLTRLLLRLASALLRTASISLRFFLSSSSL